MALLMDNLLAMAPEDLPRRLLEEPENQWFDRKSARVRGADLAKTLAAMANAEGGIIAIGLHDGVCEGIDGQAGQAERMAAGRPGLHGSAGSL